MSFVIHGYVVLLGTSLPFVIRPEARSGFFAEADESKATRTKTARIECCDAIVQRRVSVVKSGECAGKCTRKDVDKAHTLRVPVFRSDCNKKLGI